MNPGNISCRAITPADTDDILDIINHYIIHSTFYFSEKPLERNVISDMLNKNTPPGYVSQSGSEIVGYAYPYRPESTFSQTVKLTYLLR